MLGWNGVGGGLERDGVEEKLEEKWGIVVLRVMGGMMGGFGLLWIGVFFR